MKINNSERVPLLHALRNCAVFSSFVTIIHANLKNSVLDFVLSLKVPSMRMVSNTFSRVLYYIISNFHRKPLTFFITICLKPSVCRV